MRRGVVAALCLVMMATAALAGCMSSSSNGGSTTTSSYEQWTYSAGGQGSADESDQLDVATGKIRAHLSVGGQASIHLIVRDDDGDVVLRIDCTGSGGCSKTRTRSGDPGQWSIDLQGLYNGGVTASVQVIQ